MFSDHLLVWIKRKKTKTMVLYNLTHIHPKKKKTKYCHLGILLMKKNSTERQHKIIAMIKKDLRLDTVAKIL